MGCIRSKLNNGVWDISFRYKFELFYNTPLSDHAKSIFAKKKDSLNMEDIFTSLYMMKLYNLEYICFRRLFREEEVISKEYGIVGFHITNMKNLKSIKVFHDGKLVFTQKFSNILCFNRLDIPIIKNKEMIMLRSPHDRSYTVNFLIGSKITIEIDGYCKLYLDLVVFNKKITKKVLKAKSTVYS